MRSPHIILILALFLTGLPAIAQNIYVQYDNTCMDKLVYRFMEKKELSDLVVYAVRNTDNQSFHLKIEADKDSANASSTVPGKVVSCRAMEWDNTLLNDINKGVKKLFIVRKEGSVFYTSPVRVATYIRLRDNVISMTGSDYAFSSNITEPEAEKNLAPVSSASDVYYKGDLKFHECQAFQFMRLSRTTDAPFTEITVLPGIGIAEERTGKDPTEADENVLQLVSINGATVDSYVLANSCSPDRSTAPGVPAQYDTRPVEKGVSEGDIKIDVTPVKEENKSSAVVGSDPAVPSEIPQSYGTPTVSAKKEAPVVEKHFCPEVSTPGTHVVQPGESLYAIAKLYGLTVKQLQEWNNLADDKLNICMKLRLTAPNPPAALALSTEKSTPAVPERSDIPTSYSLTAKGAPAATPLWKTNQDFHTVQQGQTLTQIAKLYGYTVERLMDMNSLTTTDIKIGQMLKVSDCVYTAGEKTPAADPGNSKVNKPANESGEEPGVIGGGAMVVREGATTTVYDNQDTFTEKGTPSRKYHIVQEGETLYGIARLYNTSIERLRELNDLLPSEVVIVSQRLVVE